MQMKIALEYSSVLSGSILEEIGMDSDRSDDLRRFLTPGFRHLSWSLAMNYRPHVVRSET
ncbi:predicted protein [Sclerotinia sclerotiorum 1980 UF-70]|uniref:Uncharacterized protein n=1 Tax=Sclerotinia sclerotiorum (strain ATCC 18683 / 1980 / Ss-1) TaxID=665079 RepID=A7EQ55_SCLS1|nr:predicted protein [Sclerotinia sclerotiorum 1980 UF-70]EDO04971.1 predicted protein [Sclerotinia sclerotiorum 1980 UF-70]